MVFIKKNTIDFTIRQMSLIGMSRVARNLSLLFSLKLNDPNQDFFQPESRSEKNLMTQSKTRIDIILNRNLVGH